MPVSGVQVFHEGGDRIDSFALFRSLWYHKWTVVGSSLLFVVLAATLLSLVTPRYSATSKVLLNPRDTQVVTSQEVVSGLDLSNPAIESEVALIRSSVLLESVVREIGLDRMPEFDPRNSQERGWRSALSEAIARATSVVDSEVEQPIVENDIQPSDNIHRQAVGKLRRYLTVEQQGKSYAISISASAKDPEVVALLVNKISERYIAAQLEDRIESTQRASDWLAKSVAEIREEVANAELALERGRAENVTKDGGSYDAISRQLVAMSTQLANARADRAEAQARHDQITDLVKTEGLTAVSEVLTSPVSVSLRGALSSLTQERAGLAENLGEDHPERIRLASMISRAEQDLGREMQMIMERLRNEVEVTAIRENSVEADLLALEAKLSSMALSSVGIRQLDREAQALRRQYDTLLVRLKETQAHKALALEEAKIIESALPPANPSFPRFKLLLTAAGVLGAGLGLALVLLRELGSATLRTSEQVARELGLKVLAALPKEQHASYGFFKKQRNSRNDYQHRISRIFNAAIAHEGYVPKLFVVTSSVEGEGIQFSANALAKYAATQVKRVIFLDLVGHSEADIDLVQRKKSSSNSIANLLQNGHLEKAITLDQDGNFDRLSIRDIDVQGTNPIASAHLGPLIEFLCEEYGLVVVGAPPVISQMPAPAFLRADALIYLVSWSKTRSATVRTGLAALQDLDIVPTGIVLTNVDHRRIDYVLNGHQPH